MKTVYFSLFISQVVAHNKQLRSDWEQSVLLLKEEQRLHRLAAVEIDIWKVIFDVKCV